MKQLNLFGFPDEPSPYKTSPREERTVWWLSVLRGPRALWDDTPVELLPRRYDASEQPTMFPEL
jgi:hypothetical protein